MTHVDVRARLRHDVPLILLWVLAPIVVMGTVDTVSEYGFGWDSHAYWRAARDSDPYSIAPGFIDAFSYSPVFLQLIKPLALLPWPVFAALWSALAAVSLVLLLRPLGFLYGTVLWLWCSWEIVSGNVFWLFAIVAAFGLRIPALWSIPILTKITPAVATAWFVVRREWVQVGWVAGVTGAAVLVSFMLDPLAWQQWIGFLRDNLSSTTGAVGVAVSLPPIVRVPVALLLVVWGAMTDRRWVIPASMVLATPVWGAAALVTFAALPHLHRVDHVGPRGVLETKAEA